MMDRRQKNACLVKTGVVISGVVIVVIVIVLSVTLTQRKSTSKEHSEVCSVASLSSGTIDIAGLPHAKVASGFCSYTWADGLSKPRGMMTASTGELLVVEALAGQISCLWDDNNDGINSENERMIIASAPGLNHGINIFGNYLYASSAVNVFQWFIGNNTSIRSNLGNPEVIVNNMPSGGRVTRTILFDSLGRLYVQVGCEGNVDSDPSRALIKRFNLTQIPYGGFHWLNDGEIFAIGMRNEVGLRFDRNGGLWGVENGIEDLSRPPWGDIHDDNPAEELNYFGKMDSPIGLFYGYPYCWSANTLPFVQPGTQFSQPEFSYLYSDSWCQNVSNVVPPALTLPAHSAPLDIIFYYGNTFPNTNDGDAFVTLHGSWDKQPPDGYKVLKVKFSDGKPISHEEIFSFDSDQATGEEWPHRPVSLTFGLSAGKSLSLFISSDASNQIIAFLPEQQ